MLPAQPNQSLIDGLACLQALTLSREPVGSRELARLLDLEPTRVNRLLKTLAYLGLAEQDERRKYRPGPGVHVLAAQSLFGSGLIRRAIGPLDALDKLGHVVAMGVLWRDQTCYLYHASPDTPSAQRLGHPRLYPAATSGLGMALLAYRSEGELRALYAKDDPDSPWTAKSPPTLDGPDGLFERLARIREQGYALIDIPDSPRRTLGLALGTPPYAAIGVSGTFGDDEIDDLVATLRDTAAQITGDHS